MINGEVIVRNVIKIDITKPLPFNLKTIIQEKKKGHRFFFFFLFYPKKNSFTVWVKIDGNSLTKWLQPVQILIVA